MAAAVPPREAPGSTQRIAVASSGGRDSTALLHCAVRLARPLGIEVVALHVHHGLMAAADAWRTQVRTQSRRWGAAFACQELTQQPGSGESVEAWARRERYLALAQMAMETGCTVVLLAHHRRDQAETWLLQALRGGGPMGLSAMPREAMRQGLIWARPWLDQPREAIDHYVRRHGLKCADDTSNRDKRFARSRLRTQVWPRLIAAFPDAEQALAHSAARAQEAAAVLREVAAIDLKAVIDGQALDCPAWLQLSPARRRLVLRAWLAQALAMPVPETLLARLCTELPDARRGSWPAGTQNLRLYRGRLSTTGVALSAQEAAVESVSVALAWSGGACVRVAGFAGHLLVDPAADQGVSAAVLRGLLARPREGGEKFQRAPRAARRSLKKQYQALGVPEWQRSGPLLVSAAGEVVFVPGLGIDSRWWAAPGEPQYRLAWAPDDAAPAPAGR